MAGHFYCRQGLQGAPFCSSSAPQTVYPHCLTPISMSKYFIKKGFREPPRRNLQWMSHPRATQLFSLLGPLRLKKGNIPATTFRRLHCYGRNKSLLLRSDRE